MRRKKIIAAVAAALLAATTLAACSSSGSGASAGPGANLDVKVTGTFGKAPTVNIPAKAAGGAMTVKTLVQGSGPGLTSSAAFVTNYVLYLWDGSSHKLLEDTYTSTPQLLDGTLLPGLTSALNGKKVGSRVLAVLPPADAYGATGNSTEGITANDTMVFVIDLLGIFGNDESVSGTQTQAGAGLPTVSDTNDAAPTITIPAGGTPPTSLVTKDLITGTGPAITSGEFIVVQYTGVNWRTGKVFDSSWSRNQPTGFQVGVPGTVILGLDTGLVGQHVGSRVLVVAPPADGYGSAGKSSAGIKGTDTLVFVVDILGVFS